MRKLSAAIQTLILIACVLCPASQAAETIWYISSSCGSDSNPGTKERPLKTISGLTEAQRTSSTILLRRGDIFFENVKGFRNCTLSDYGEGHKPVICGFMVQNSKNSWQKDSTGIWRIDLNEASNFHGFRTGHGNIGCLFSPGRNRITGNLVKRKDLLKKEGDFFVPASENFRYLYIKAEAKPQKYCFSAGIHGIERMENCLIENIAVVGFGYHGMCHLRGCTVRNCDIDIIGGSVLTGYRYWVRFGNGVEFWIGKSPCNDNTVEHCQISRCYDTATTIQGQSYLDAHSANNHFRNNRIAYCRQGYEHWTETDGHAAIFDNCDFSDNVLYCCGNNRFEGTAHNDNDAALLAYHEPAKEMTIRRNLIYCDNYRFNQGCTPGISGGEVYIRKGSYLLYVLKDPDKIIKAVSEEDIRRYRAITGDDSAITIVEEGSPEDRMAESKVREAVRLVYPTTGLKF